MGTKAIRLLALAIFVPATFAKTIEVPSGALYIVDPKTSEVLWKSYMFQFPMEVRALSDDRFLVCDFGGGRVVEIDRQERIRWETPGDNAEDARRFANGETLVVNNGNSVIHLLDSKGKILRTYKEGLDHPTSAVPTASRTLLVADARHGRIVELDEQGATLRENTQVSNPQSLEPLGDGTFLVADANLHQVFELDRDMNLEPIARGFHHPSDAKLLPTGNIVVADTSASRLVEIDRLGNVIRTVQFDQSTRSVDVLSDGTWLVALTYEEKRVEEDRRSIAERISSGDLGDLSIPGPVSSFRERNRYAIALALLVGVVAVWVFFEIRRRPSKFGEDWEKGAPPPPIPTRRFEWPKLRLNLSNKHRILIGVFSYLAVNGILWVIYSNQSRVDSIRLDCAGSKVTVFFEDQEIGAVQTSQLADEGAIGFSFWRESANNQACEKVTIRDLGGGKVLYEADFTRPETLAEWRKESGDWRVVRGVGVVNDSKRPGVLRYEKASFGDCSIEFRVRNPAELSLWVRSKGRADYAKFTLRPERHMDAWVEVVGDGKRIKTPAPAFAKILPPFERQVLKVVRQLLGSYFFAFAMALVGGLGFLLLFIIVRTATSVWRRVPLSRKVSGWGSETFWRRTREGAAFAIAASLSVWMFFEARWVAEEILERMPHLQDSVSYLFQARIFANGDLYAESLAEPYRRFFDHEFIVNNGKWFGLQSPGTALLLSLGVLAGKHWLVNPVLGGLSVFLMFLCGRSCYGTGLGLLAAGLLCLSPWVPLMSGTLMSHPAGLVSTLLLIWGLVEGRKGNRTWPFAVAGLGLGLLLLVRLGNALAVGVPAIIWAIAHLAVRIYKGWKKTDKDTDAKPLDRFGLSLFWRYCVMGAICLAAIGFLAFYHWRLTGNPLQSTYKTYSPHLRMGFGPDVGVEWGTGHDRHKAIANLNANLTEFQRYCFPRPSGTGSLWERDLSDWFNLWLFAPLFGVFLTLDRRPINFLLAAIMVGIVGVYYCYFQSGIAYGPRFYYALLAPFILLSARGAYRCAQWLPRILGLDRSGGESIATRLPIFLLTVAFFIPIMTLTGWTGRQTLLESQRGFNGVNGSTLSAIKKEGLENAIVFVEANRGWVSYGRVFGSLSPYLDDPVLFAREAGLHNVPKPDNTPLDNRLLLEVFPNRKLYRLRGGRVDPL